MNQVPSDFLFARPSFLSGVARAVDLSGRFDAYNESPSGAIADWLALLADWRSVGTTLVMAMRATDEQTQQSPRPPVPPEE